MTLSASPSRAIPKSALNFFTLFFKTPGNVDPQLSLIFSPLGVVPIANTFAPKSDSSFLSF